MPTPPPPAAGAQVSTFTITNTTVPNNGVTVVQVDSFADGSNANDVTIVNTATDPITALTVEKMGGNDNEQDVIRIDLSEFSDNFTLELKNTGSTVLDQLFLEGLQSFSDNGDGTFTGTYYGSDTALYTVTVIPQNAVVSPYYAPDSVITGETGAEVMAAGYTDTQGDEIDGTDGDDDFILGNSGSDTINAGDGNDTVYGDFESETGGAGSGLPDNAFFGPPPSTAPGAEVNTRTLDNTIIDNNGAASVSIDDFATPANANDVTIVDGGTDALTGLTVDKFGGNDTEVDVLRLDLSGFNDDFTLEVKDVTAIDQIVLTNVFTIDDNGDGTQTVTYVGSDSALHTLTILATPAQVQAFVTADSPYFNDDVITAGAGDDFVDGGQGDDDISGEAGADTLKGGSGDDTIDGGIGADDISGDNPAGQEFGLADTLTYSYAQNITGDQATHFGEQGTGTINDPLLLIDDPSAGTEVRYHQDDIIEYAFGQNVPAGTSITLVEGDGVEDGIVDIYVSFGTTDANGDTLSAGGGGVGYENAVTNGQSTLIYSGPSDSTLNLVLPINATHIQFVTQESHAGWDTLEFTDKLFEVAPGDDVLTGGDGDDTIDGGFGNDAIDGGADNDSLIGDAGDDTILGGAGLDDISGGSGTDSIDAGTGDDSVDGGTGDDIILGGDGDDTLYGGAGEPVVPLNRVAFQWSAEDGGAIGAGDALTTGTQTVSGVDVSYTISNNVTYSPGGEDTPDTVYVAGIDAGTGTVDPNSAASIDDDTTMEMSFSEPVENVQFRINDFELNLGVMTITAFDALGNEIQFDVTEGSNVNGSNTDTVPGNDTFSASGSNADNTEGGSILVSIPGPVSSITFDYVANNDSLTMTDVWFDDPATGTGGAGNDLLVGGDGDDVFVYTPGDGLDTISDFNFGNTGTLKDDDQTNNDFIDLSTYYDNIKELHKDHEDDGILNQSNTEDTAGNSVDYANNTQFAEGEGLVFTGATPDGNSFTVENTDVICFAAGTLILTQRGERPVESLVPGDRIFTRDNGMQTLQWCASRRLNSAELLAAPRLKPIVISPELTGGDAPLVVSPQHGLLMQSEDGKRGLVRAVHLMRLKGGKARVAHGMRSVTYFHLMFSEHQIIYANGVPCESFYPGPMALNALSPAAKKELYDLFPDLFSDMKDAVYGPLARDFIRSKELPSRQDRVLSVSGL